MTVFNETQLFSREWNCRTSRLAFLRAVVVTFMQMAASDRKPSSTSWTTNHAYLRRHGLPLILREWSAITGLDSAMFPWSEDEVATTWEEWRKTNAQYRGAYREQLGLPPAAPADPPDAASA
jgi:hypothetical protein